MKIRKVFDCLFIQYWNWSAFIWHLSFPFPCIFCMSIYTNIFFLFECYFLKLSLILLAVKRLLNLILSHFLFSHLLIIKTFPLCFLIVDFKKGFKIQAFDLFWVYLYNQRMGWCFISLHTNIPLSAIQPVISLERVFHSFFLNLVGWMSLLSLWVLSHCQFLY